MNRRARLMVASWTAVSLMGCAVGMSYEAADPDGGEGSITMGTQTGGGGRARAAVDRTRVPSVGEPPSLEFPVVQDYTLDNGLRVVLVERRTLPLVSVALQFRGGAAAHDASKAGLASLAADMIDEGTRTRSALDIADAVDLLGASLASSAGYDASQLRLSVLRTHFPEAMKILADVVMNPTFPGDEVERLRAERLAAVMQRADVPSALADDAFAKVLYGPDHPYGLPLLGTRASLESLTRDDIVAFHMERYAPGQATLIVAGDLDREALDEVVSQAFAGWSGGGTDPQFLAEPVPPSDRTIYVVDKPGAAQSEVRVGRVGAPRGTEAYYPLTVLNTVLGGSFTSRLNAKLREEKGYTYGAGSHFDMRRVAGPFEASAAVATDVTDGAVTDFILEIDRMAEESVPDAELTRVRNYLALRLPQRFETADDVVRRLSELVLYDVPLDFYAGYVEGVQGVDAQSVRDASSRFLTSTRMAIVVAGDRAVIEEPLKALGLGAVVVLDDGPVSQE